MMERTDVVIVGSGIAGSALARALVRGGLEVLVLEHEVAYRDKVRGENMPPWGVLEIHKLDLEAILLQAGGHYIERAVVYDEVLTREASEARVLPVSGLLPGARGSFDVGHPQACEALSRAAEQAGARVLRSVDAVRVSPGAAPEVSYVHQGVEHTTACRLVVGADGRQSTVRKQLGLTLTETEPRTVAAGLLVTKLDGFPSNTMAIGTEGDLYFLVFPRAGGVARLYLLWNVANKGRFAGQDAARRFLDAYRLACLPYGDAVAAAEPSGPCATYPMNDTYMDEPLVEGAVLIGDAAGWNDPIIGQGLSIALRDARMVSEIMLGDGRDWSARAFTPYAVERKERLRRLRIAASLTTDMRCTFTPEGAARRGAWYAKMMQDPLIAATALCPLIGPESMPAEGFEPATIERVLALRA
jgi:2-polyprenyl-6-methoxyphenol hydroxylase-like FAD-dependent oxidoreductase